MADVSENLEDEDLQSLIFLLSGTLPKERLARATVRQKFCLFMVGLCNVHFYFMFVI